jgi:putative redox protein
VMNVHVETSVSEEKLEELHQMVQKRCPVFSSFIRAGIPIQSTWTKMNEIK